MAPQKPMEVDVAQDSQSPDIAALVAAFHASPDDALAKGRVVCEVSTLSESTRDRQIAAGTFPKALKFGARCKRWRVGDVRAWLAAQSAGLGQWAPAAKAGAIAVRPPPIHCTPAKRPGRPRKPTVEVAE